jgi:hypothetical protein
MFHAIALLSHGGTTLGGAQPHTNLQLHAAPPKNGREEKREIWLQH